MARKVSSLLIIWSLLISTHQAHAQINWNDASSIAPGAPIQASGIIEIRDALDDLRQDVDTGGGLMVI